LLVSCVTSVAAMPPCVSLDTSGYSVGPALQPFAICYLLSLFSIPHERCRVETGAFSFRLLQAYFVIGCWLLAIGYYAPP
jgi:hypothetical protein